MVLRVPRGSCHASKLVNVQRQQCRGVGGTLGSTARVATAALCTTVLLLKRVDYCLSAMCGSMGALTVVADSFSDLVVEAHPAVGCAQDLKALEVL